MVWLVSCIIGWRVTIAFRAAQFCLNAMLSYWGSSAYQMALGSNPVGPCVRQDDDGDLDAAKDASILGRFVQEWKLRMLAQEAPLKEIAIVELRPLLPQNEPV